MRSSILLVRDALERKTEGENFSGCNSTTLPRPGTPSTRSSICTRRTARRADRLGQDRKNLASFVFAREMIFGTPDRQSRT